MPRPTVNVGQKRPLLWLRPEIESWAQTRNRRADAKDRLLSDESRDHRQVRRGREGQSGSGPDVVGPPFALTKDFEMPRRPPARLKPTSDRVSARFARHPRRDTVPELALRRVLHRRGLRYRVDCRPTASSRRRADIVFTKVRVAVFVDGCYWHGCPEHCRPSGQNLPWWIAKIATTKRRDANTDEALARAGWEVVRVWAHVSPDEAADRVEQVVGQRSSSRPQSRGRSRRAGNECRRTELARR
jgi:DNA mismatch endonuclease (patch repair protein)